MAVATVRSRHLQTNGPHTPPGPVEIDPSLWTELADLRNPVYDGSGIRICVVDLDLPQTDFPIGWTPNPAIDGHGTLVYEIVRAVAPRADVEAVAIGATIEKSDYAMFAAMTENRDADVLVVSLSVDSSPRDPRSQQRRDFLDGWLRDLTVSPRRPLVVLPTGNVRPRGAVDTIAEPGCFRAAITIGSITVNGERSTGSRYGIKMAPDARHDEWWLAPGGEFDINGPSESFVRMGGDFQAGTSVANAVAGGLIAGLLEELRVDVSEAAMGTSLQTFAMAGAPDDDPNTARLQQIVRDTALANEGAVTRWMIIDTLTARARPVVYHNPFQHGRGRLSTNL